MLKVRVIPTLLWKQFGLVKGSGFDSWRRVGPVLPAIKVYNQREVDELVLVDIVAHQSDDDPDFESIDEFGQDCFVPLTVGGGITRIEQVQRLLRAGADKVSVNTAAYANPDLIAEIAKRHGVQSVVASIDVRAQDGGWTCFSHAGRKSAGRDVTAWARELEDRGAGEILITSIERDGTMQGYDLALIEAVVRAVRIPVIASGGAGNYQHMVDAVRQAGASRRGRQHFSLYGTDARRGKGRARCGRHSGPAGFPARPRTIGMSTVTRVAMRVDASATIGSGHLRRCLSLAQALVKLGATVDLLVRPIDEVAPLLLRRSLENAALTVRWLPACATIPAFEADGPPHQAWAGVSWTQDASDTIAALNGARPHWLVIDHYAFDARWHRAVREAFGCRLLVIDDVADRALDADALLDQNWDADHRAKYAACLNSEPLWLTGPRYALLSEAYRQAPRYRFHPEMRSLGIFLGGTDPGGASALALQTCRESGFTGHIEVVSMSANPHLAELRLACASIAATSLTLDEPDLANFFARHDLHIGAGGGATWERCCIGVPSIGVVLAANQRPVVLALDRMGAMRGAHLGSDGARDDLPTLSQALSALRDDAGARRAMAERASALVDGRGAQRAALRMCTNLHLRPATRDDGAMLHGWRNDPAVRALSGTPDPIPLADHLGWLQRVLAARDRWLFVAEVGELPLGCIRFDRLLADRMTVSLYLDPELLGLGLGRHLLRAGERTMHALLGRDFTVDAHVLPENTASRRIFEASGYHGGPPQYQKVVTCTAQHSESSHEDTRP